MRCLLVTPEFEQDTAQLKCSWWLRVSVLELAKKSIELGTWPTLERQNCSPSLITHALGLGQAEQKKIGGGISRAISMGVISPSTDRTHILFNRDYFHEIECSEVGQFLTLCKKSNLYPVSVFFPKQQTEGCAAKVVTTRKGRPRKPTQEEIELFHRWRKGLKKTARTMLDKKRLGAIRKARSFGFTHQDLQKSIDGWIVRCLDDPWRMEQMNRHELSLFLRDAAHIEEGMEAFSWKPQADREIDNIEKETIARRAAFLREK